MDFFIHTMSIFVADFHPLLVYKVEIYGESTAKSTEDFQRKIRSVWIHPKGCVLCTITNVQYAGRSSVYLMASMGLLARILNQQRLLIKANKSQMFTFLNSSLECGFFLASYILKQARTGKSLH